MARSWTELLGDAEGPHEIEVERAGFFGRLRDSLSRSRRALTEQLAVAAFDPATSESWERLEEALLTADVGVRATAELVRRLEARGDLTDFPAALAEEVDGAASASRRALDLAHAPAVILVVGVNGTGKTTTIGKLAQKLREHGRDGDARRRRHVPRRGRGAARDLGEALGRDVRRRRARRRPGRGRLRRDRRGRRRRDRRHRRPPAHADEPDGRAREGAPRDRRPPRGRAARDAARRSTRRRARTASSRRGSSREAVGVTGVVLTKLDGSAKGGIAVAIAYELGLPVKLVGVGEGLDDLRPFDPADYARALVAE